MIQSSCFIFIVSDGKKCAHFSPLLSFCALIFQNDSRKCYHFNIPRVLGDFPLTRCVRDLRRLLCVSSSRPPRTLLNTTAKLVPITALISLPKYISNNHFLLSLSVIFHPCHLVLLNNTLPTDMAGYATKPSLAFCHLLVE